jgi:hypothetical protein
MVDSGTCDICGKPLGPETATTNVETGNLVHAACLKQKEQAASEKDQAEPAAGAER